ncbi:3-hydroxyacyl-ACP dehydratase FabZ [Herbidospora sp. NEAU-GS84]|uniref:3-hydroxyacyl-[acyl-carrier-protein] dehydratase n=1 Tax=Herbidospora solisilvae TaxID=2696284 RepID=A0A7C9JA10_9ACTN|nr:MULTISPECIES: 3-hydroxyacyl-ACP dehydratase FabZ [Herbidospora]NAS21004.1 3-hydroxyacyl-ACP dehydratase FabZ [Herbidospora solisilvae]GLX92969.1 3-hydroxyacyl-[acyl-carrier-protein] dehydratase FabZ [Herbidospora sp. NBRC 101105]
MTIVAAAPVTGLTNDQIREVLPHRWPMLLLDRVGKVEPGVKGTATKNVTGTELWFQGHFPTEAVLPGVVIIEAMAQLAGVVFALAGASRISYLAGVRSMRFRRPVVPGDRLTLTAERTGGGAGFAEFRVSARVDGQVAAEGNLTIVDPAGNAAAGKV